MCLDAARLVGRLLAAVGEDGLEAELDALYHGPRYDLLEGHFIARTAPAAERWWLAATHAAAGAERGTLPHLLVVWFNAGRSLADAARLVCLDPRGPQCTTEVFCRALARSWRFIPPRDTDLGAPFTPNAERTGPAPSHVPSQMLDRTLPGRHLRDVEALDVVVATLHAVLGGDARAIERQLLEGALVALLDLHETARRWRDFEEPTWGEQEAAFAGLAVLDDLDAMPAEVRAAVDALARKARAALRRAGPQADAETLKRGLAARLYDLGPTLTEEAWEHLLATDDADDLAWALALAEQPGSTWESHDVKRALLMNHALRASARTAPRDGAAKPARPRRARARAMRTPPIAEAGVSPQVRAELVAAIEGTFIVRAYLLASRGRFESLDFFGH